MLKLEERTCSLRENLAKSRLKKFARDGLKTVSSNTPGRMVESVSSATYEPINLTGKAVNKSLKELCSRGPSFVPTPNSIDWNDLQLGWLNFKRKVRWRAFFAREAGTDETYCYGNGPLDPPKVKSSREPPIASIPAVEVFLSRVEKDLFEHPVPKAVIDNLSKEERDALKEFRSTHVEERDLVIRLQDKGNNFVLLNNDLDARKVKEQMDRGSFKILDKDPSVEITLVIEQWADKWKEKGLSAKWISFICNFNNVHPGINYPLIKTHKVNNPARVITSGCGTPIENLSLFVEKYCKVVVNSITCRVQDTRHMLNIVDELNSMGVSERDSLVSFDVVNMFPSIDNQLGIERVRAKLTEFSQSFDVPLECIIEALEICLKNNCSKYREQYWQQENGTAMGPKNSCSYADIVAEFIDKRVLDYRSLYPELRCWFRFRDDTFVLWRGNMERLQAFFQTLNTFDSNLQFTMEVGGRELHFLDLSIVIVNNRIETSVYSKPTDAHLYLNANSAHPKTQILGIAKGVALRLRRICSLEKDFTEKSKIYQEYLIKCGHDSKHVKKVFEQVAGMTRQEARKKSVRSDHRACVLSVKYNPRAPDLKKIIKKHGFILEGDEKAKKVLSVNDVLISYKRNANLKELLAPSNPYKVYSPAIKGCFNCKAKRCDSCKNFLLFGSSFRASATGRLFEIAKSLTCTSDDVVYLACCGICNLQGVGSTVSFKPRLANYKSHIKRKRRTCSIVNHFIDKHGADHSSLKFMLIDQNHGDLRKSENFWIGILLTNLKGLNDNHDFVQQ